MSYKILLVGSLVLLAIGLSIAVVDAQRPPPGGPKAPAALAGTGFTYQGQLKNNGALVSGTCDFVFSLWDAASSGNQVGTNITQTVPVTNGLFTATLNAAGQFNPVNGVAFTGDARYLQIAVGCPSPAGSFTALSPRQALTPAPYALALPGLYTTWQNVTSPNIIGGWNGNAISATVGGATISGGGADASECGIPCPNRVTDIFGTIAGGSGNVAGNSDGSVINAVYATVGGGRDNTASGSFATVGGGYSNVVTATYATIGGGRGNTASGDRATVGGGAFNIASGSEATISGGNSNTASGPDATISGGINNTASGTNATIGGGSSNTALGFLSFAAGNQAKANHQGAFVWADSNTIPFTSTATNQFSVRATGGARFVSAVDAFGNPIAGVQLASGGGAWSSLSDRAAKDNFYFVNGRDMLVRLSAIPIQTWNYKTQDASIRHIGPMAQDFYAAFNVGEDDKHITTVDADGVAFAAIQGLYQVVQDEIKSRDAEIEKLKAQSEKQQVKIENLETRLAALEQASGTQPTARVIASSLPLLAMTNGGDWNTAIALVIGAVGMVAFERARKGGAR